jgi:hypothetical protein
MTFALEAIRAEAGDCLLLHWGDNTERRLIVVDGGPSKSVYKRLKGRLDALREGGGFAERDEPLPIELLMVSHIDDDHIDGILHLTRQLLDEGAAPSYEIKTMWHNSFNDLIGDGADELRTAARGGVEAASAGGDFFDQDLVGQDTALIVASVDQGRELRDNARLLGLEPPLLVAKDDEKPRNFGEGLKLRLVGPLRAQVDKLHVEWEKRLEKLKAGGKLDEVAAAAFTDGSAANLASIVVLAERDGKTMLLTGDARGDFLADSLQAQGLLGDQGSLHVDLFKLPHHGSSRNVERETFAKVTADHYVVSGDGKHGNPDLETFTMLFGGREDAGLLDRPFSLHLTYDPQDFKPHKGHDFPKAELAALLAEARQAGHDFTVVHPAADEESVVIDLED